MSTARAEVLGRVRRALADVPADERPEDVEVRREYRTEGKDGESARLERFARTAGDYGARVHRVAPGDVTGVVAGLCADAEIHRLLVPPGVPAAWRPEGAEIVEDIGLDAAAVDDVDAVLTGCAAAIAETGTLVLDGGDRSGRRLITLVPDHHLCVVEAAQVVGLVPEALARLAPAVRERRAPVTLISGPSASSDIELERVEGVHGPRTLDVILVA